MFPPENRGRRIACVYGADIQPFVGTAIVDLCRAVEDEGGEMLPISAERAWRERGQGPAFDAIYTFPFDVPVELGAPADVETFLTQAFGDVPLVVPLALQDLCWDKLATQERLLSQGVPMPDTLMTADFDELRQFVREHRFVVLKHPQSCGGYGHLVLWIEEGRVVGDGGSHRYFLEPSQGASIALDGETLRHPGPYYAQRLVAHFSRDEITPPQVLRAYIIDKEIPFWTERFRTSYERPSDWIVNISSGAQYRFLHDVGDATRKAAMRTAEVLGLRFGVVDIVRTSAAGVFVIEADVDSHHMIIDRSFKAIPEFRDFFDFDRYVARALVHQEAPPTPAPRPLRRPAAERKPRQSEAPPVERSFRRDEPRRESPREFPPRPQQEDRPRPPRQDFDRPSGPRQYDDRPRPPRQYDDRPRGPRPDQGDRRDAPRSYEGRPQVPRQFEDRPRPPRQYDDRPRPPRQFEDRPRPPRPEFDRPRAPRADEPAGGDRPWQGQGERRAAPGGYAARPQGPRSYDDRPRPPRQFDDRPRPERSDDDRPRPPRQDFDRPRGPRQGDDRDGPPRGDYNDRRREARRGGSSAGYGPRQYKPRPDGIRTDAPRPYGPRPDLPRGARPQGAFEPRGFSGRAEGQRPYDDRPRGPSTYGDRPRGPRPYDDRPRGPRPDSNRRDDRGGGDRPRFNAGGGGAPRQYRPRPEGARPYPPRPTGGARPFRRDEGGANPYGDRSGPRPEGAGARPRWNAAERRQRDGGPGATPRPSGPRPYRPDGPPRGPRKGPPRRRD